MKVKGAARHEAAVLGAGWAGAGPSVAARLSEPRKVKLQPEIEVLQSEFETSASPIFASLYLPRSTKRLMCPAMQYSDPGS